jgi:hypothetical protein
MSAVAFVSLALALVFAVDARKANAPATPTTTAIPSTTSASTPAFGARILQGRTASGAESGQSWWTRQQPWWVPTLIFAAFAFVAAGFVHVGPTPVGFVVCRKARWEIRDTFDPRGCFANFLGQMFDDPDVRSKLDEAREGLDEAREELERARAGLRR